jgi:hypothetical protein
VSVVGRAVIGAGRVLWQRMHFARRRARGPPGVPPLPVTADLSEGLDAVCACGAFRLLGLAVPPSFVVSAFVVSTRVLHLVFAFLSSPCSRHGGGG